MKLVDRIIVRLVEGYARIVGRRVIRPVPGFGIIARQGRPQADYITTEEKAQYAADEAKAENSPLFNLTLDEVWGEVRRRCVFAILICEPKVYDADDGRKEEGIVVHYHSGPRMQRLGAVSQYLFEQKAIIAREGRREDQE